MTGAASSLGSHPMGGEGGGDNKKLWVLLGNPREELPIDKGYKKKKDGGDQYFMNHY